METEINMSMARLQQITQANLVLHQNYQNANKMNETNFYS